MGGSQLPSPPLLQDGEAAGRRPCIDLAKLRLSRRFEDGREGELHTKSYAVYASVGLWNVLQI